METCNQCGHQEADPEIVEVEMTDQRNGYTMKIGVWMCPACEHKQAVSFSLPLDENGTLEEPKRRK